MRLRQYYNAIRVAADDIAWVDLDLADHHGHLQGLKADAALAGSHPGIAAINRITQLSTQSNVAVVPVNNGAGHVAAQWATLFENPALGDRLEDRNILGAQLAWAHGPWLVTLYGTNLTNQHYVGAMISGLDYAGPPRQYGLRVLRTF